MENKSAIKVKMFGTFQAEYEGRNLLDTTSKDSEFVHLMHLMWFYRNKGISRSLMMDVLFGEREPENPAHAMQCAFYHTKRRLMRLGIPECRYIEKKDGNYYWNKEIPLETDTGRFDLLIETSSTEQDEEKKCRMLLEACYLYEGDLLAEYGGVWIAYEARIYREHFQKCVEEAAQILRKKKDYQQLRKLGEHAAKADPCANWEMLEMEALCAMGKAKESREFYARTVDFYLKEFGTAPSPKMKEYLTGLDDNSVNTYRMLSSIQESMEEESTAGGYLCSAVVFQAIYQMLQRIAERGGQSVCLMMCTVLDQKGRLVEDEEVLDNMSDGLCRILQMAVRRGDIVTRYAKDIYLLLLVNACLEDCELVQARIDKAVRTKYAPFRFVYSTANLIVRPEKRDE